MTHAVESIRRELKKLERRVTRLERQQSPATKLRLWTITLGPDEPIPQIKHMKLTKPIKPGFRRPFTITPDEPVDVRPDGTFFAIEVTAGDSQTVYNPASTATSLQGWFYGDGATGDKSVTLTADGHVGDGDQPVSLVVDYTVANPDATSIAALVEGTDEPIPA
jgi:hypothetical protein